MVAPFAKGALLGMSLVLPLGPQNAFILHTGAKEKSWHRILPVVCMAGLCDALLIIAAVYGSRWVGHIAPLKNLLVWVGILFLLWFGYKLLRDSSKEEAEADSLPLSLLKQLVFCATISILNPHAIIDTFVVIGAVAMEYSGIQKHWFGIGCIFIDCFWFIALALLGFFVKKMNKNRAIIKILNRISALIMFYVAFDLFTYYLRNP